jgi:hypothetical protein
VLVGERNTTGDFLERSSKNINNADFVISNVQGSLIMQFSFQETRPHRKKQPTLRVLCITVRKMTCVGKKY